MTRLPFYRAAQRALLSLLTALPLLLLSATGLASEDERWFQVEVIVFTRANGDSGEENWPRNPTLSYPFNWIELRDPDAPPPSRSSRRNEGTSVRWNESATRRDPLTDNLTPPDLQREPYYRLPSNERELNRHATALRRHSGNRVLFHEAWRQPFRDNREAPALIISGGEAYGSHFELEGSLRLTLSRYLHLNTNLWLTRFDPNTGQTPGSWPQLPNPPNQVSLEAPLQLNSQLASPFDALDDTPERNAWGLDLRTDSSMASLPEFLREPYLPSRIVTLNQQRRMRSGEIHYVDHPLMGLLIRITPYDRPAR